MLSATAMAPVWIPGEVGVKVTPMVQFAPCAAVEPQVVVLAKSPSVLIPNIDIGALPIFVSVIGCSGLL
jgi:hypothetical protein